MKVDTSQLFALHKQFKLLTKEESLANASRGGGREQEQLVLEL